jgi:hypothetical protein
VDFIFVQSRDRTGTGDAAIAQGDERAQTQRGNAPQPQSAIAAIY